MTARAGATLLFDGGKTTLLGLEYIAKYGTYCWVEPAGKKEPGEIPPWTACRECNEETGWIFNLKRDLFERAEREGKYVDYTNPETGVFTRMYYVHVPGPKYTIEQITANAVGKQSVGVSTWAYFNTEDVISGILAGTPYKLFSATASKIML